MIVGTLVVEQEDGVDGLEGSLTAEHAKPGTMEGTWSMRLKMIRLAKRIGIPKREAAQRAFWRCWWRTFWARSFWGAQVLLEHPLSGGASPQFRLFGSFEI